MIEAGLALLSLVLNYASLVLGMGYGTILTPILLILGFDPVYAVSAVIVSQLAGNAVAVMFHHLLGNADFSARSDELRAGLVFGAAGALAAVFAYYVAVSAPKWALKAYIAVLTLAMGFLVLYVAHVRVESRRHNDCLKELLAVCFLASFNKGLTGGGYGPLVTGGQLLLGIDVRSAIAVTSLAELVACSAAAALYLLTGEYSFVLLASLTLGAIAAAPLAAYTVSRVGRRKLKTAAALAMIALGAALLAKLLL